MHYDEDNSMERIYNDAKSWVYYEDDEEGTTIGVYRRCPQCGRYLPKGKLLLNGLGKVSLKDWHCKKHGAVQPYFDRNIYDPC